MYVHSNPNASDESLPDTEVFESQYWIFEDERKGDSVLALEYSDVPTDDDAEPTVEIIDSGYGYFFAFGFPGYLWDSEPFGPYQSEDEALRELRSMIETA